MTITIKNFLEDFISANKLAPSIFRENICTQDILNTKCRYVESGVDCDKAIDVNDLNQLKDINQEIIKNNEVYKLEHVCYNDLYKILSKILQKNYNEIIMHIDTLCISEKDSQKAVKLFTRYISGEPITKILNENFFWKSNFYVNEDVLDPRFDTETLIQAVLSAVNKSSCGVSFKADMVYKNNLSKNAQNITENIKKNISNNFDETVASYDVLELCTGSGCVLISLLGELENSYGIGVDICDKALKVANINLNNHKNIQQRCKFIKSDMFKSLYVQPQKLCGISGRVKQSDICTFDNVINDVYGADMCSVFFDDEKCGNVERPNLKQFDIIISNPPYIPSNEILSLDINVIKYDPYIALDGGCDGLDFYRRIANEFSNFLKPHGVLCLEIGYNQHSAIKDIFYQQNNKSVFQDFYDENGILRVLLIRNP